ncbi:hypothetical protein ACSX1A_04650 [Pontibacter sp. MBLB2868]|uniref:hypothetical protein n=1 Tax=Pontibacter sp. MBLB2868 TaxID=3451555 RepID=UPI003F7504F4
MGRDWLAGTEGVPLPKRKRGCRFMKRIATFTNVSMRFKTRIPHQAGTTVPAVRQIPCGRIDKGYCSAHCQATATNHRKPQNTGMFLN